ncbi:hypothetical protein JL721_2765 [Aureococcus anophagefferens]|nr:hypothetical protein JL721_2765 [Aureococcus anophagefferens]
MASFAPPGEPTPSMRDGYSASEEKKKRRQTSWYISECGLALKLPKLPVESPARLGKLVATCGAVRHPKAPPLDQQSEAFAATKHEVLVKERALLYAIGFDVEVENPMLHFIERVKQLKACKALDEADEQQFSQLGINFIGDSYRTSLCLQQAPQKIASAMAFITIIYMRKLPPKSDKARLNRMFATLSISERSLNSICSEMVSLYGERRARRSSATSPMGHLHPEVLRELGLAGPAPRARSPAPGELKRPRPP